MSDKKKERKTKKKTEDAPAQETADDAPAPADGGEENESQRSAPPPKAVRGQSNVFALFNQGQIQEFKEAFQMIDVNRDGYIDQSDLCSIWQQTGREPDEKVLDEMIAESPGQLNFTHFLTLFGEKMHGTDSECALREAFAMFDSDKSGKIDEKYFKDLLMNTGDQFTKEELKQTWKEAPIDGGKLDYLQFVKWIKHGNEGE